MGRIRLVFVADEIPATLQRLVEFLNEQMPTVEVLAVEIRQRITGGPGLSYPPSPCPPTPAARGPGSAACCPLRQSRRRTPCFGNPDQADVRYAAV